MINACLFVFNEDDNLFLCGLTAGVGRSPLLDGDHIWDAPKGWFCAPNIGKKNKNLTIIFSHDIIIFSHAVTN